MVGVSSRAHTSEAMRRLVGKGADWIARVGAGKSARSDGLASDAARQTVAPVLSLHVVLGEVSVVGEGQGWLLLVPWGGRVAGKESRRHCAQIERAETTARRNSAIHVQTKGGTGGEKDPSQREGRGAGGQCELVMATGRASWGMAERYVLDSQPRSHGTRSRLLRAVIAPKDAR